MEDRAQGVLGGDPGKQRLQLLAVGDVAGNRLCLATQLLQFGHQLARPSRRGAAAAGQEQVAGAVLFGEMAGGEGAEAPRGRR